MRERIGCSAVGILHSGGRGAAFIPRPNKGVKAQATGFTCWFQMGALNYKVVWDGRLSSPVRLYRKKTDRRELHIVCINLGSLWKDMNKSTKCWHDKTVKTAQLLNLVQKGEKVATLQLGSEIVDPVL